MKKIFYIFIILSSLFFIDNVSAKVVNYSYTNPFSENIGSKNKIISSVEGNSVIKDDSLYLSGSSYIKYNLNSSLSTKLIFDFDFYKSNSDAYSRLLYLGGINREIEVKGSSKYMYINGEITSNWLQNEWNNMRIEYENGVITYFVNDVQVKQENYSNVITFIQFGKGSSSSNTFTGFIDNLTIYMDSEEITDNMLIINDAWFKGILKYDTVNKEVYVRNNNESEYTLLFNYTKDYFIIQYKFGCLTFVESDISPIYYSSNNNCSYNSEGFICYSNSSGNIGKNDFMHTYQYDLGAKKLIRDLPFGASDINIILKSNTSIYSLDDNSLIFEKNVVDTTIPTITITKENENKVTILEKEYITDVTLKIDFGTIYNDKYLYMYKYGAESEWSTITLTENTFINKTYKENNTLYVQVLDRTNYEVVTSSTFIVSSIEKLPDNYVYDNVDNDTVNTDDKVIWHKCDLSLENGVALCEVTLENYNNDLYNYYYKINDSSYSTIVPDEKTKVLPEVYDTSLFLKSNNDISLYQKWKKSTDNFVSYDFVVKLYHNSTITLMRETKDTGFKQYYTFTVTMLTEKNDMNQIEQFIYNHLLSKFYFIHQFKQIIEYVSSYNFEENAKAPRFTFDMSFIGLSPINVDMTISEHTRLLIHGYIKLFASITVVVSFIRETSKLFKK